MSQQNPYKGMPRITQRFLRSSACGEAELAVCRFHGFLRSQGHTIETITPRIVRRYLALRRDEAKETGYDFKSHLFRYIEYLSAHYLPFDPQALAAPSRQSLPETAEQYLAEMQLTLKKATVSGRRTSLRRFHSWLRDRKLTLRGMTRDHAVEFLQHLAGHGLHPSTRVAVMINVRAYLRWLEERRLIRRDADDLLRAADRPKMPQYLPRPFPPEIDRELDSRLRAKDDVYSLGLRLMRKTGLRVGELAQLARDCTTDDADGHCFLKVPLGKLNTERLVPLDAQARGIVAQLTARADASGAWLFTGQEGGPAKTTAFREALRQAAEGLVLAEPATTHRLRHTYATELLNAGVSLVGVMKLLGHTDYRMTLRYAALLPETVREQYDAAIAKVEASYEAATAPGKVANELPTRLLADVISVLKRDAADGHGAESKRLAALAKRLDAINTEVRAIEARKTTHKPRSREEK